MKLPKASNAIDWEAELGAVIGKKAKDVPLEKALDYVAGYTVANELSARDLGRRNQLPDSTPFKWDWVGQKCFDDACPIGPWIVPASDIKDPQKLGIKLWVNDVIKQDSNTSDMIFNLAEQLSHLSSRITLYPGDIILTGTPGRRRRGAQGIPQGRRHHQGLGRKHRHAHQQDGVTGGGGAWPRPRAATGRSLFLKAGGRRDLAPALELARDQARKLFGAAARADRRPADARPLTTSVDFTASRAARASLSITSRGVPAGAIRPNQIEVSKSGMPASTMVGTSGRMPTRFAAADASALSLPAWTCEHHGRGRREHHLDAAGEQVGHRLRAALVGHVHELDAGALR